MICKLLLFMLHIKEHNNEAMIGEKMVVNEEFIKLQTFDNNSGCKHSTVPTYMSLY